MVYFALSVQGKETWLCEQTMCNELRCSILIRSNELCFYFRLCVCIERRAINTLAYLCDGDARTGLNGLQMAVQARLTNPFHQNNNHECSAKRVVITEDHVKEGLQRSHILYDRAGEWQI